MARAIEIFLIIGLGITGKITGTTKKIPDNFRQIYIYDDGIQRISKGSTILDFSSKKITILRNGDGIYNK